MSQTAVSHNTCADILLRVVKAARISGKVRACLLTTRDRDYALTVIKRILPECDSSLFHYTVAGRKRYRPDQLQWVMEGNKEGVGAHELLLHAGELKEGGIVILEDCLIFLRDEKGDVRMRMRLAEMLSRETWNKGLILAFVEPPEATVYLPSILADQFVRIDVPYPRALELEEIAKEEIALVAHRTKNAMELSRIQQESTRMSSGMVGLTRSAARDALQDALALDPNDFDQAFHRLQERKADQLSRELAMNVLETKDVEEPVGLDFLVDFLMIHKERMKVIGKKRAKGVLLIGPPGTGKTMLARSIGKLVGLPVVEFRISSLMNALLGKTEELFMKAFATLAAMSPNVVFIDEIEKVFGDSSERDGGTMMRCTGSLLSWLSDNPFPNFIVATANNLSRMGEIGLTMTRSGRFDSSFFVDLPTYTSRRVMLQRWLTGKMDLEESVLNELAARTEKFSGADLQSLVELAGSRAAKNGQDLSMEYLNPEIERKRMRVLALYHNFENLREWGKIFCDPAGPVE